MLVVLVALVNTGCRRPYQKPVFQEIQPHETAFVIPLEGDVNKQDTFSSADILLKAKVAAKRIEIPTRWVSTGRFPNDGDFIQTVRVIKVDRTPVTRIWTAEADTGTSNKKQALSAESSDSISVSSGFTLTGLIDENMAHVYLYRFNGKSLQDVIDSQVFNSVQAVYTEICNKYDLNELRSKKQEITEEIRKRVIPLYAEWGITIMPDMGIVGGFTYENKNIQEAIDNVFVSQTKKQANEALRDAQASLNEQQMLAAKKDAEVMVIAKEAEAKSITLIAKAISASGNVYIENKQADALLKNADAMLALASKWDGKAPTVMGGGMPMMFNMPLPSQNTEESKETTK
jgi:hypothetical protein